jgi:biopolymer transport protein ExbD
MGSRKPPEINASSMADIAFLLLVFFLVTTTMDSDWGLARRLPPPVPDDIEDIDVKQRNVFEILVNSNDELLVEGDIMQIDELRDAAKEFIVNPTNSEELPEKKPKEIPLLGGTVMVSKQVISLQNDNGTSYGMYIQVQNELVAAYSELRNELGEQKFGKTYDALLEAGEEDKVDAIRDFYPQRISEAEPKNVGN